MKKELKNLIPDNSLECLKVLRTSANSYCSFNNDQCEYNKELADNIEKALKRLESIDNAKSSEALKCLEEIGDVDLGDNPYKTFDTNRLKNVYSKEFDTIKQFLLKAQKILNIFKSKKYIPLDRLNPRFWNDKETYNEVVNYEYYLWLCKEECPYVVREEQKLTKDEFNSIMEMLNNEEID